MKLVNLSFAMIAAILLGTASLSIAHAAGDSDNRLTIGMAPVNKSYKFDAGSTTEDFVTVTNAGKTPFTFKMSTEPYSVKNISYEADYLTVTKNTDVKSWVSFEKTTYSLEPGSSVKVNYSVNVPTDATPGGHYGVIFAETQPSQSADGVTSLQQKTRVGTLIYATVKGEYTMGGAFNGIRIPSLQFKSPLKSELDVENTGNSDFPVETVFAVSDAFGSRKYTETKSYQMLPKSTRKIQLSWGKSPGFGFYQVTISAKFLDKQTTKTSYVLMAPIAFYMIFAVGLLVGVIYFVQKRR